MSGFCKILAIAYACEPEKGSEPGVGWGWVWEISQFAEVWVITRANNRESIEAYLTEYSNPNLHFIYIDTPKWMRFWKQKAKGARLYYNIWQIYGLFKVKKILNLSKFHAMHHITFVSDYMPSFFSLLKLKYKKLKFIWGPVGSHPEIPEEFLDNVFEKLREKLKNFMRKIGRSVPLYKLTKKLADYIIVIDSSGLFRLGLVGKKVKYIPAIGVNMPLSSKKKSSSPLKILFSGRLVPLKGPYLALLAFEIVSKKTEVPIKMFFVGKGKERKKMERFINKKKLNDIVELIDWIDRKELMKYYEESHIFLYPSFEGGGMVVLEALAHGLPVVCLDYGGPGEMVNEMCGVKVRVSTYDRTVNGLANALLKLVEDVSLREKLSKGARERVKKYYTWEAKGKIIQSIYKELGLIEEKA